MGLSPDQRFTLIMLAVGTGITVLGWLIRRVIGGIDRLTSAVNTLGERVARLEGPAVPRHAAPPRRRKQTGG